MSKTRENPDADIFFSDGCGRCALGGTPECKVNRWRDELAHLRLMILECGLNETLKWGVPCYTFQNSNILMISALKESCVISFLKGALLKDEHDILSKPGENTQAGRVIRFTDVREIIKMKPVLKTYIYEAVQVEKTGLKFDFKKNPEPLPEELLKKFEETPAFKKAFYDLTPGRQRGYVLYFSAPKHSGTRTSRIEKNVTRILDGKGIHDK